MWYIVNEDNELIDIELGSTDIFDYMGQTIQCDYGDSIDPGEHVIDDAFILAYDWFEDHPDWEQANAYRKGMGCSIQEAFDQWNEAYQGEFNSEKAFSESLHGYIVEHLPTHIQYNIDWQGVWDSTDRHSFFESDGFYFENL